MRLTTTTMVAAAVLLGLAVGGGDALAKKGGGGKPGGGGDPPTNTTPLDIAFRFKADQELALIQDDGTGIVSFAGAGTVYGRVGWSPDGTELAFWSDANGTGIYTMGSDGSGLTKVVATNASPSIMGCTVAWSPVAAPDGKYKLAFLDEPAGGGYADVFMVNLDGTGLENVTQTASHREQSVSWSPDAKQLAVDTVYYVRIVDLARRDVSGVPRQFDVFSTYGVVPVNATSLGPSGAEWSKTGGEIVFGMLDDASEHPRPDLFVLDVSWSTTAGTWIGTTPVNITNTPHESESQASWSPDDSEIVCFNQQWKANGRGTAKPSLTIITVEGGARRSLIDSNDVVHPVWRRAAP